MTGSNHTPTKKRPEVIDQRGPWPFVTRRVFRVDDIRQLWSSRHHRKGLLSGAAAERKRIAAMLLRCLWKPQLLNWWIGIIFALGSLLFAVAGVLSLAPALAQAWSLDATQVNAIFFMGSIPFTIAAYLQLFQAANAGEFSFEISGQDLGHAHRDLDAGVGSELCLALARVEGPALGPADTDQR